MPFFSFVSSKNSLSNLPQILVPNKKYYSKDISLWKHLNNINKTENIVDLKKESRKKVNYIGAKILICFPPNFGLGDAIEYCIAIQSLIKIKKFEKIGIAFFSKYQFIFNKLLKGCDFYPLIVSEESIKNYDTIFHITLEIENIYFQKYRRSDIANEICKYFKAPFADIKIQTNKKIKSLKTISMFPVASSIIRSLPFQIILKIADSLKDDYRLKVYIDDSNYSKNLEEENSLKKIEFIKPNNVKELDEEISKLEFGIFVDSGPLHLAKIYDKKGILIETSVSNKILLNNTKKIIPYNNLYISKYCNGPCGLIDIFSFKKKIGCYETNALNFQEIKKLDNLRNLQRFDKNTSNKYFASNPVGCIKNIDSKKLLEFLRIKLKECL